MQRRPPSRILAAVAAVFILALGVVVAAILTMPAQPRASAWLLTLLLGGILLASRLFPVHLASKTYHTVTTAPLFVAALVLPVQVAMGLVALAMLIPIVRRREPWFQSVFNASQYVIQVAAVAALYRLVMGSSRQGGTPTGRLFIAMAVAALAMYLINIFLVHGIVSVQKRSWSLAALWRLMALGLVEESTLFLLGALAVIVAEPAPLAVLLPLAALVLVHRELVQARLTAEATSAPATPEPTPTYTGGLQQSWLGG